MWGICRASWIALLVEQGFAPVVAAGQATAPPRLLGRQVVVVGVSDGAIRGPAPTHLARRLQALRPPPAAGLVSGFSALALRDSLPDGAWGPRIDHVMRGRVPSKGVSDTACHAAAQHGQVVRTWNSVCMVYSKRQHRSHPIPHATLSISSQHAFASPREHIDYLFRCRMLSGLGAAAVELDACAALALLDAFQRQGWFRAAGEARTMVELRAGCVAAYARFLPEAVGILQTAGGPAQHHMCPMWYTLR